MFQTEQHGVPLRFINRGHHVECYTEASGGSCPLPFLSQHGLEALSQPGLKALSQHRLETLSQHGLEALSQHGLETLSQPGPVISHRTTQVY